jgi:hypothetical protein
MNELKALLQQIANDVQIQQQVLMQLLNTTEIIQPVLAPLEKLGTPAAAGG